MVRRGGMTITELMPTREKGHDDSETGKIPRSEFKNYPSPDCMCLNGQQRHCDNFVSDSGITCSFFSSSTSTKPQSGEKKKSNCGVGI